MGLGRGDVHIVSAADLLGAYLRCRHEVAVIFGLDLLVAFLCMLGFYFVILPYLLQTSKEDKIRTALRTWTFVHEDMDPKTTKQQQLAAKLYIEFLNLLLQLSGLMLLGTCGLAPINWYFGEPAAGVLWSLIQRAATRESVHIG